MPYRAFLSDWNRARYRINCGIYYVVVVRNRLRVLSYINTVYLLNILYPQL